MGTKRQGIESHKGQRSGWHKGQGPIRHAKGRGMSHCPETCLCLLLARRFMCDSGPLYANSQAPAVNKSLQVAVRYGIHPCPHYACSGSALNVWRHGCIAFSPAPASWFQQQLNMLKGHEADIDDDDDDACGSII